MPKCVGEYKANLILLRAMDEGQKLLPEWDWGVDVKGVGDPELAQILARDTIEMLHLLSESGFDLRTLDGVTIATDYPKALSEIDRGLKFQNIAKPTNENGVEGVAMALGIMREGHQRTHLVLTAWIPLLLRSEQEEQKRQAFGMIAHEAAHIHFAAKLDSRIPNTFGRAPSLNDYPAAFQIAVMHIWDEYAATRMSGYIDPDAAAGYQENLKTLVTAAESFRIERATAYRMHGDHKRVFEELNGFAERLLCSLAYLLGHLDSLEQEVSSLPLMTDLTTSTPGLSDLIQELHGNLRMLWETQDLWTSQEVFSPLCNLVNDLLAAYGVYMTGSGDNWRMTIPHTAETMPTRHAVEEFCTLTGKSLGSFYPDVM